MLFGYWSDSQAGNKADFKHFLFLAYAVEHHLIIFMLVLILGACQPVYGACGRMVK